MYALGELNDDLKQDHSVNPRPVLVGGVRPTVVLCSSGCLRSHKSTIFDQDIDTIPRATGNAGRSFTAHRRVSRPHCVPVVEVAVNDPTTFNDLKQDHSANLAPVLVGQEG